MFHTDQTSQKWASFKRQQGQFCLLSSAFSLTQSVAQKNIINADKPYKYAIKEFLLLHMLQDICQDSPAAWQQKPKPWNFCALRWCSSQRDLPTPACLHLLKKIKETFPSSHVIIVLSRDSAWTLDFQIVQVWSHWKCCKSCFHRGRISQKGGITDTVSHADLLCSFKDFSQKQRSWKPQNLPQFGKKAKNLQWLWSRTLLLADRQTTVRS